MSDYCLEDQGDLIHFQAILSKSSLTAGIIRALSNSFFKFKTPLGYPKILMIVSLILLTVKQYGSLREPTWKSRQKTRVTSTINLALKKDLMLNTPKRKFWLKWWKYKVMKVHGGSNFFIFRMQSPLLVLQICVSLFTIYSGSNNW